MQPFVSQLLKGKVKQLGIKNAENPMDREWKSGMFKEKTSEKVWLSKTNITGDEVADTKVHGGPEKALFAYPVKHYAYWKKDLSLDEIDVGGFGENLAVIGIDEEKTCIGDTYKLGEAIIQVSQPRRPCWKPARRFKVLDLALRIQNSGLTGWYYRVLKEGYIEAGLKMELLKRPYPQWTIAAANDVMYKHKNDAELTAELAACELLALNWKQTLNRRLEGIESVQEKRVFGPNQKSK